MHRANEGSGREAYGEGMIVFSLPADIERRSLGERLRIYARQIAAREGGLRLIALLEEAADELDLRSVRIESLL